MTKGLTNMHKCNNSSCPGYNNGKCTRIAIELDSTGKCIEIIDVIAEVNPHAVPVYDLAKAVNLLIRAYNREHQHG